MSERPKFFDDLAGVAGGALSAFSGLRDELSALVRARVDETLRALDLVRREELDVMSDLIVSARSEIDQLTSRLAALETMVVPAAPRTAETMVPDAPDPTAREPASE
jgi:BMFP domain-containing protein YqiC